jgi:CDP-diacylglycerol--serine O-phosphatidyltransferase
LKQYSEIGKQLDSLADMVTFGVVPGVIMFKLMSVAIHFYYPATINPLILPHANQFGSLWGDKWGSHGSVPFEEPLWIQLFPYAAFIITLFSALRLAKFNIDTRQTDSFIGVPTPANTILIASFPLILRFSLTSSDWPADIGGAPSADYISEMFKACFRNNMAFGAYKSADTPLSEMILLNPWILLGVIAVMSFLLVSELPLFSLKFKSFGWKGNEIRWIFLALCVMLLATLQFAGIPLAIVLYIMMSVISNLVTKSSRR